MVTNVISGLVLFALSVGYYLAADAMPTSILDTMVPSSAFPKLLACAGMLFSAALIAQSFVAWRFVGVRSSDGGEFVEPIEWHRHVKAFGLLAISLLFILALETIGYPLAIGLLILVVSRYQGYPISATSIGVAVIGAFAFWLFFVAFLGIHMPLGIWPTLVN